MSSFLEDKNKAFKSMSKCGYLRTIYVFLAKTMQTYKLFWFFTHFFEKKFFLNNKTCLSSY